MKETLLLFSFVLPSILLFSQTSFRASGRVVDAADGEGLPFANVLAPGLGQGVNTDEEGFFTLELEERPEVLEFSFLGYEPRELRVDSASMEGLTILLVARGFDLAEVEVREERGKYRRKGNPAVELIKKAIARKKENRMESLESYRYDYYEKIQNDITGMDMIPENSLLRKQLPVLFDYVDSTDSRIKYLPAFLQEAQYSCFFRRKPRDSKKVRNALRMTMYDDDADPAAIAVASERLYEEVDVYGDQIQVLGKYFLSPLSPLATTFYRFYVQDTLMHEDREVILLSFLPANKNDIGFLGDIFIANDGSYAVAGLRLNLLEDANINYVDKLRLQQQFFFRQGRWLRQREYLYLDLGMEGLPLGIRVSKTSLYSDFQLNELLPDSLFKGGLPQRDAAGFTSRDEAFWRAARTEPLSRPQVRAYEMLDTLKNNKSFRNLRNVVRLTSTGMFRLGPVDIGSAYSFFAGNPVEGFRLQLGGITNARFHPRIRLKGYVAYGFKDQRWKYSGSLRYGFTSKFTNFPDHYLQFTYERDNRYPGQIAELLGQDNLLLAATVNENADRMFAYELYRFAWFRRFSDYFSTQLTLSHRREGPAGNFDFRYFDAGEGEERSLASVNRTELELEFTYAPGATFLEGAYNRIYLPDKEPVLSLRYRHGIDGVLDGEYRYHGLELGLAKRWSLPPFGFTIVEVRAGKIWGEGLPYSLLHIPSANQTITYLENTFNAMNFLEFVADEYAHLMINHSFQGFLFNRLPVFRELEWRELVGLRLAYGNLRSVNNPLEQADLIQFSTDEEGNPRTFALQPEPYLEASFGIGNILRVFELHLIQRYTYLENPGLSRLWGVPGLRLQLGVSLEL